MDDITIGARLRDVRKRAGLSQRELATAAKLSVSTVRRIEQDASPRPPLETLRTLAAAMDVKTTDLLGRRPEAPEQDTRSLWAPVRDAILLAPPRPDREVTEGGLVNALDDAVRLYHGNRYEELARILPALTAESADAPPLLRSRVMQLAGSVMVQTANRDAAKVALDRSVADAEAAGDPLDAASAIITMCWLWLIEGRFDDVRRLAVEWADRVEPRFSTATTRGMSVWGWLLLRGSAAAIRDNRPGEADDMMRLAEAAAVAAGRERGGYRMYWTTFGPATTAMKRVENAVVDGRPDVALRLARRVPRGLRPTSDNRNRHLLDVASAHLDLKGYTEAFGVLCQIRADAGPWLAEQRMARNLVRRLIDHRRTVPDEMQDLADAVRLPR